MELDVYADFCLRFDLLIAGPDLDVEEAGIVVPVIRTVFIIFYTCIFILNYSRG